MLKNCDANCDAQCDAKGRLMLRNKTFYYIIELPRVNNKRRYLRLSLHTKNYYEAREILKEIQAGNPYMPKISTKALTLRELDTLRYVQNQAKNIVKSNVFEQMDNLLRKFVFQHPQTQVMCALSDLPQNEPVILSSQNNYDEVALFARLNEISKRELAIAKREAAVAERESELIKKYEQLEQKQALYDRLMPAITKFLSEGSISFDNPKPTITIEDMLGVMVNTAGINREETLRKRKRIIEYIRLIPLDIKDQYYKFHTHENIDKITAHIANRQDLKGDSKLKHLRYLTEFVNCAIKRYPNAFTSAVIENLPFIEPTKKSEKNPHEPYTPEELAKIFDLKQNFFTEDSQNKDIFYICMIALYTGGRINAVSTPQYKDIIKQEGIYCFNFIEDDPVKNLKTEESERITPIHNDLLKMGLIEYIENKKKKTNAKDTDFIFPVCKANTGKFNVHITRRLFKYLEQLSIRGNGQRRDFHSFRNNASIAMQKANIPQGCILRIIGWKGSNMMEQSYSKYPLADITNYLNQVSYDAITPYTHEWREKMLSDD